MFHSLLALAVAAPALVAAATVALTSSLAQVSAMVGTFLPPFVSFIQQQHWSKRVRTMVGVAACVVASVLTAAAEHKLNWTDWGASFLVIFSLTKLTYMSVWKPTGVSPMIEKATSTKPSA